MIIISYLTENFIKETLKFNSNELRFFLKELCILNEHLFFVFEPNKDLKSIKKKHPKDIKQTNINLWVKYLADLYRLGRVKHHTFIKDYYKNNELHEAIFKEEFIKKSLIKKVFYLSFKNFYIKNSYLKMESLGETLDEIKFNITCLLKDNKEPTPNIRTLKDREDRSLHLRSQKT